MPVNRCGSRGKTERHPIRTRKRRYPDRWFLVRGIPSFSKELRSEHSPIAPFTLVLHEAERKIWASSRIMEPPGNIFAGGCSSNFNRCCFRLHRPCLVPWQYSAIIPWHNSIWILEYSMKNPHSARNSQSDMHSPFPTISFKRLIDRSFTMVFRSYFSTNTATRHEADAP